MSLMSPPSHDEGEEMSVTNFLKFFYTFGVPAAIAVFLVYFVTTRIDNGLDVIQVGLESHKAESRELIKTDAEIKLQMQYMTQILLNICVNTAKIQSERNACFGRN